MPFQKGHPDYRTPEGLKRMGEKISRAKKGVRQDVPQLKQHQFKGGHTPWNKGLKGYKRDLSYLSNPDFKKKHSEAISKAKRGKPRPDKRGEKSNFWKGGVSDLKDRIGQTFKYKEWRRKVFERDKYRCVKCHSKGYLEAHHKEPFTKILEKNNIKTVKEALKCQELWEVDNGETLCIKCHVRNGRPNETKKPSMV